MAKRVSVRCLTTYPCPTAAYLEDAGQKHEKEYAETLRNWLAELIADTRLGQGGGVRVHPEPRVRNTAGYDSTSAPGSTGISPIGPMPNPS